MAYTEVITVATGDKWTAANHNLYIRDNFAAGVPGMFQAAGDMAYATGEKAAARLAKGAANSVLTVISGLPAWSLLATRPHAKAYRGSGYLSDNTTYNITWTTEELDTNGFIDLDTQNQRITIPEGLGGNYIILAHFDFNFAGGTKTLGLAVNGTTVRTNISDDQAFGFSDMRALADDDYIQLTAKQVSGGTKTMASASFMLIKI